MKRKRWQAIGIHVLSVWGGYCVIIGIFMDFEFHTPLSCHAGFPQGIVEGREFWEFFQLSDAVHEDEVSCEDSLKPSESTRKT